jgi:PAS domain S-box-containing protein
MESLGVEHGPRLAAREVDGSREATIVVDEAAHVVEWNGAAGLLFGYEREEAVGRELGALIVPASRSAEYREQFAKLLRSDNGAPGRPQEAELQHSSGRRVPVSVAITRTMTRPPNFILTLCDLGAPDPLRLSHMHLAAVAHGSEDAIATLTPEGIVMLWNRAAEELYGYTAAEAVGCQLAPLIVPPELMHEPQRWLAEVRAGQAVEAETRRLRKDRSEVLVSVNLLPVRGRRRAVVGSVMIARDVTMRRLSPGGERIASETAFWQGQIELALGADSFTFAAQPIFDLRSGEIDHYELLLRMQTRQRLLRAREFIVQAERTGQIRRIDLWVVRHGLELALHRPVAINISALSLGADELFAELDAVLARTGLDPANLTLEITETAAIEDLERAEAFTRRLTSLGCAVALDDFGTGFGSLTYLNRLPVRELKIDREFVDQVAASATNRRIVASIVAVGRNFGARTVAEGVESESDRQQLEELGVDLGQGYLLGAPFVIGRSWYR